MSRIQNSGQKISKTKNNKFLKKLGEIKSTNSYEYWKMLNKKIRDIARPSIDELEKHFRALNDVPIDSDKIVAENFVERNYNDSLLNEPITEDEVISACKKLKNNKKRIKDLKNSNNN